jgi:hypothetical protein
MLKLGMSWGKNVGNSDFIFKSKRAAPESDLCRKVVEVTERLQSLGLLQQNLLLIRINTGSQIGDQKHRKMIGAIEKRLGGRKGRSDYLVVWKDKETKRANVLFMEAKVKGNYLSPDQKDFAASVKIAGSDLVVFRSVEEYLQQLSRHGVFLSQSVEKLIANFA